MSHKTAALIIIGNEILSGRTQDVNTQWIASRLGEIGVVLSEVRVVPDIEDRIVAAVNEIRPIYDYVLSTGGIGPTHDDITTSSIAKAFGVDAPINEKAREALLAHYKDETEMTEARLRMARIPVEASLIDNPISGAPGFRVENVFVMAGVPRIMQAMLKNVIGEMEHGAAILSSTLVCGLAESDLADALLALAQEFYDVDIGSYPSYRSGEIGVSIVARSTDRERIDEVMRRIREILSSLGEEPQAISFFESDD